MAESHNSEVTTLWRYTNLFIIIIIINMKKALLLSSTSPFSQCNSAFCVRGNCACAESRDAWVGGQKRLHFWNPRPRFAYSLYNFYWATTTIKGRLLSSVTNAKALDCVNFLCVTVWPWPLNVNLEQLSYMAGHVTNPATKFEDPTNIRSWVTTYNDL